MAETEPGAKMSQGTRVFRADSIPFHTVPWGRTKSLIGPDVKETRRNNKRLWVGVTENSSSHRMHNHPDQDEVLYVLGGHGENLSVDGTVRPFGPGDVIYIPAGENHENRSTDGPVTFLVVKVNTG